MAITIETLLNETVKEREARHTQTIQEEQARRLVVIAQQQERFLRRWDWSRFYTLNYTIKKPGVGIEKVARAVHSLCGAKRSYWVVERFKGSNELHLHGLDYAAPDIVRPTMEEIQTVCNKRYGNSLIKEVETGGVCGYVSKMSGADWANPQYLGKW